MPEQSLPNHMVPASAVVTDRREEVPGTVTLRLDVSGSGLARPKAGQFAMLWVFGVGEVPISVSRITTEEWDFTIRSQGAVTTALSECQLGSVVGIRGPFGSGWPLAPNRGRDLLLVAGGLGLAALLSAVQAVIDDRDAYGRVSILVGARSPESLLFDEQLVAAGESSGLVVNRIVDHASPNWRGEVGVVTKLLGPAIADPARTTALVCGPEIMMRFVASELDGAGVPAGRIYLSMERNMKCAVAHCGRCQLGPVMLCRDGPVLPFDTAGSLMAVPEL